MKSIIRSIFVWLLIVNSVLLIPIDVISPIEVYAADTLTYDSLSIDDHIYMGDSNATGYTGLPYWRVIDLYSLNDIQRALVISEDVWLGDGIDATKKVQFDEDGIANPGQTSPNEWQGSDAQKWCSDFYNNVLGTSNLIEGVAKNETETTDFDNLDTRPGYRHDVILAPESLTEEDKVFFLSAEEVRDCFTRYCISGYLGGSSNPCLQAKNTSDDKYTGWWLRSKGVKYYNNDYNPIWVDATNNIGVVDLYGSIEAGPPCNTYGSYSARPAFYLDLSEGIAATKDDNGDWVIDAGTNQNSDSQDLEPNNDFEHANKIDFSKVVYGTVDKITDPEDIYYFVATRSGSIRFKVYADKNEYSYSYVESFVYDSDYNYLDETDSTYTEMGYAPETMVEKGKKYYVKICGNQPGNLYASADYHFLVEYCEVDPNIYNLGDETYSFENYVDNDDKKGHCFGMSMTSSGYYLKLLDSSSLIDLDSARSLYSLSDTKKVRKPICYYNHIQGSCRDSATVAGGSFYLSNDYDIESDWNDVINYVKSHEYDNCGSLQIGYRVEEEGGHAVNFLYYKEVNGQQRLYIYDNMYPDRETYLYKDNNGNIKQAPVATFSAPIDCIALRDVTKYFQCSKSYKSSRSIYAQQGIISVIGNVIASLMEVGPNTDELIMYELPDDIDTISIVPNNDYASFIYQNEEYVFKKEDEETYGVLYLNDQENDDNEARLLVVDGQGNTSEVFGIPLDEHEHDWAESYTVDTPAFCNSEGSESIHCSKCDVVKEGSSRIIPKETHSFRAWTTTKAATEIAAGEKIRKCSVCGTTEKQTIAMLKPTLPAVKITKPAAAKKAATVKWKRVSKTNQNKIAKIQIQYSTDKTFKTGVKTTTAKKSAASKKIKKLASKKTYYVRVRAYKKVGDVVHVSKWSAKKKVKVK